MQMTEERQTEKTAVPFPTDEGRYLRFDRSLLSVAAVICLGFLLTSTAWLAWEYHLLEMIPARSSDLITMVAGYGLQAAGTGLFALAVRRSASAAEKPLPGVLILHTLCLILSLLSPVLWLSLLSGLVMNLLCGYIAGYYLFLLVRYVPEGRRGIVLGLGYGISCLMSWLLSRVSGLYYSSHVWILCALLTGLFLPLVLFLRRQPPEAEQTEEAAERPENAAKPAGVRPLILLTGAIVLLFSLINNISFAFPAADLMQGISVESSRLFYAAGLILAGLISDRSRKLGAVTALAALVIPYMLLALQGEPISRTVLWALSYFACGFYSVYRMIVFSDLATKYDLLFLSGFGLMTGRVGDALGESICVGFASSPVLLISIASLLFVATVFLFFRIYHPLYAPEKASQLTGQERFYHFAARYDLSARERDMLRLLLDNKTNGEIAQELSISENTVKFHIHNLLQKTGCKNRNDLLACYISREPNK